MEMKISCTRENEAERQGCRCARPTFLQMNRLLYKNYIMSPTINSRGQSKGNSIATVQDTILYIQLSNMSTPHSNEYRPYFVPGFGISRHIFFSHVNFFLGPYASVRPYSFHGREGYLVTAPGPQLTKVRAPHSLPVGLASHRFRIAAHSQHRVKSRICRASRNNTSRQQPRECGVRMDLVPKIGISTDLFTCIKGRRGTRTTIEAAELRDCVLGSRLDETSALWMAQQPQGVIDARKTNRPSQALFKAFRFETVRVARFDLNSYSFCVSDLGCYVQSGLMRLMTIRWLSDSLGSLIIVHRIPKRLINIFLTGNFHSP